MFGIKKLQDDLDQVKNTLADIQTNEFRRFGMLQEYNRVLLEQLAHQKLDLSGIKTKFHDLDQKIDITHQGIMNLSEFADESQEIRREILDKIVTDDTIMQHVKELNEKLTFLFDYMKQLEKLLSNVEIIVDKCLPEMTIKLPKKKKATTRAS